MSSTRNKNSKSYYKQRTQESELHRGYVLNMNSQYGKPYTFLGVYQLPDSTQPTRIMNPHNLSENPIDIESMLRGIHSTDLVGEPFRVKPKTKRVDGMKFYERVNYIIPSDMITTDQQQRPLFD